MSGKIKAPLIRFKGFSDAWEQRKFSEIFIYLQNNSLSRADLNYELGSVKNIHYGDILIKFGEVLDVIKEEIPYISNQEFQYNNSAILENGDVVIADAAEDETVGKCSEIVGLSNQKILSGLHTIPCRPTQSFATGYLGYFMNSNAYHDQLLPLMQGTKVSSISKSALNDTVLIYPKIDEQTQIGTFFRNLDNLITLHQRKLDLLGQTKQTFLQKMFPKGGEGKPEIRFDGFTEKWGDKKLGEVLDERNVQHTQNDEYPLVSFTVENGVTPKTDRYEREQLVRGNKDAKKYKRTQLDDIVYNPANLKFGAIARNKYGNAVFSPIYVTFEVDTELAYPNYIEMFVTRKSFIQQSLKYQQGTVYERQSVNQESLLSMDLNLPQKPEQIAIGNLFQNLDHLTTLHTRKLESLKSMKQTLLKKMFI